MPFFFYSFPILVQEKISSLMRPRDLFSLSQTSTRTRKSIKSFGLTAEIDLDCGNLPLQIDIFAPVYEPDEPNWLEPTLNGAIRQLSTIYRLTLKMIHVVIPDQQESAEEYEDLRLGLQQLDCSSCYCLRISGPPELRIVPEFLAQIRVEHLLNVQMKLDTFPRKWLTVEHTLAVHEDSNFTRDDLFAWRNKRIIVKTTGLEDQDILDYMRHWKTSSEMDRVEWVMLILTRDMEMDFATALGTNQQAPRVMRQFNEEEHLLWVLRRDNGEEISFNWCANIFISYKGEFPDFPF